MLIRWIIYQIRYRKWLRRREASRKRIAEFDGDVGKLEMMKFCHYVQFNEDLTTDKTFQECFPRIVREKLQERMKEIEK